MKKQEVIERFCSLQGEVAAHQKWEHAADCFCGVSKCPPQGYQNEGRALEFIKQAVAEKIAREREVHITVGPTASNLPVPS